MAFILDLIVIAIIALFALISAKKGFVRTLIEVVGFVLVILFANSVSPMLSDVTYDKLIEPSIISSVEKLNIETGSVNLKIDAMPDFINNILGSEFNLKGFEDIINENISAGMGNAVATASQTAIKPIVTGIFSLLYTVLISVILLFVVNILANLVNKLFSFSIVGKANKILGVVLGMIKGVVVAVIFCTLISFIVSVTTNGFLIFTNTNIEGSLIFKLLCLTF